MVEKLINYKKIKKYFFYQKTKISFKLVSALTNQLK